MKRQTNGLFGIIVVLACLAVFPMFAVAQTAPATGVLGYPGAGVLQAGDFQDSFLPQGFGANSQEAGTTTEGNRILVAMGNFTRDWAVPGGVWPRNFPWTIWWRKTLYAQVFDPDPNFNPTGKGEAAPITGKFGQLTFRPGITPGHNDPARRYSVEPYFVDGTRRQHMVYEAAWPTNTGIDVKFRAHSWAGPNWGHFNDFVIMEIELKNTGAPDMDQNGVVDQVNNVIEALTLGTGGEIYMSIRNSVCGGRCENSIAGSYTRMGGWVADPDPDGNPWAFSNYYAGTSTQTPTAGNFNMGFNPTTRGDYTDIWIGWAWLDAKEGGLPSDRSKSVVSQPTKSTIFNTHPIGVGAERGRYVSAGSGGGLGLTYRDPRRMFILTSGAFMKDGGRARSVAGLDYTPNPSFFASGDPGNVTNWVPLASPGIPDGDQKILNTFTSGPWEDGKATATTDYPTGFGRWTQGYNFNHDFNGDCYSGVGPFRLGKDSTITVVLAYAGGFRLEGLQKAIRAARHTYANDYNVPVLPAAPEMKVSNTLTKSVAVEWDKRAETDAEFAGYKIWKVSNFKKYDYLNMGLRLSDRYQEQMVAGADIEPLKKPINPKFDAYAEVASKSLKGQYQPEGWGNWELLKTIPAAELAQVTGASPGYNYRYEDKDVVLGFSYWYYVSAYKEGTYTGPGGETTNRIETAALNFNGADGFWHRTYPSATANANFPKTADELKQIGNVQVVFSALATAGDVANVGVRPNPYKRAALHDNFTNVYDHKLLFYNLPPECKITILDVSGQIIDEIQFTSSDANRGSIFWDMFSKDGQEVASGLYVYVVESRTTNSTKTGYFSILR